jgi:transposase-like protein
MIPAGAAGRDLVALRLTDEAAFVARVRDAYRNAPLWGNGEKDRASSAARTLGVNRRTLFRWLKQYPQILETQTGETNGK